LSQLASFAATNADPASASNVTTSRQVTGRRGAVGAIAVLIAVIAVFVVARGLNQPTGPHRHADGAGPLRSIGGAGHEMKGIDPSADPTTRSWTFGTGLCVMPGQKSAVLTSVVPRETIGHGFAFRGAAVRSFARTAGNEGINSVSGWPPPEAFVPDPVSPIAGFTVSNVCSDTWQPPYTELLIGLELTDADAGGWRGFLITYSIGDQTYVVDINHDLLICGGSTKTECGGPPPS
jgi:hypothetical protein